MTLLTEFLLQAWVALLHLIKLIKQLLINSEKLIQSLTCRRIYIILRRRAEARVLDLEYLMHVLVNHHDRI